MTTRCPHYPTPTPFAAWLERQLTRKHRTAYWLAGQIQVDLHTVLDWFQGVIPGPILCERLAEVFHVPLATLYAVVGIPLGAPWELTARDWFTPPDITWSE